MEQKLYICITPFFPTHTSFRGSYVYDQIKAIGRNSNYRVVVFTPKPWRSKKEDYEYGGVKVHYFENIETPSYIMHGVFNGINARLFMKRVRELGIDVNDVAVAHGHTAQFATYALKLKENNLNIKTVVQHHDPDPFTIRNGKWAQKSWNAKYRAKKNIDLFERVDLHLCISKFVKDSLYNFPDPPKHLYYYSYKNALSVVARMKKPNIRDSYILYNGVDCNKFFVNKDLKTEGCFTIGCIGNLVDWKDHITLLKAVKVLLEDGITDIKLIIIGTGVTYDECTIYIDANSLNEIVEMRTEVHHSQLLEFYNSIDLYVQPSYFEGFGCVCTEAAACGVPFMICKHQGAAEYIASEEEDMWLFEPHDYVTLASNIAHFKKHRQKQTLIYPYDINELVKKYINYIK